MNYKAPDLRDYKAVLFDLDGTLIESMGIWEKINRDYLARYGKVYPEGLTERLDGTTFVLAAGIFISEFDIPGPPERIMAEWTDQAFQEYGRKLPLKPGVFDILEYLKKNQVPTAIASANTHELIKMTLKERGMADYFREIVTCDEVGPNKPEPDVYLEAAGRLGVAPKDCLVFEDMSHGILAGKRAGMTVCAMEDDYSLFEQAAKAELSDFYIDDYKLCLPLTCK